MLNAFEILEPATAGEAAAMLARHGDEAALYAGGTELLIVMKEGLARFPYLVNLKTAAGLADIALSASGDWLEIGALSTHRSLERSPLVRRHAPLLAEVEAHIANPRVRAAGTLGGNLCFAEPHSDPATLLLAWGAQVELLSEAGRRNLPLADFVLGMFETARRPDEVLTRVRLPLGSAPIGGAYEKFSLHERPTATVAALLRLVAGVIQEASLAVCSVGPVPQRMAQAEALLRGAAPGEEVFRAAADLAARAADAMDDLYGSAEYKRHLVGVMAARALARAAARAHGQPNA